MAFPTDWDIDQYRLEHECEDHWELRRAFLETHKDKFPEERLVCLAQVFYNVEFMGCRYPEKTMRLVAQLSNGVADEHREKMKTKLQRTFVQASDAASTKVKGRNNFGTAHTQKGFINFCKGTEENDSNITVDNNSTNDSNQETLPNSHELEPKDPNSEKLTQKEKIKTATKRKMQNVEVEDTTATKAQLLKKKKMVEDTPTTIAIEDQIEKIVENTTVTNTKKKKKRKKKKKVIENGTVTIVDNSSIETPQDSYVLQEENHHDSKTDQLPKRKKKTRKKKMKLVEDTAAAEITPDSYAIPDQSCFGNSQPLERKEATGDPFSQQPKRMKCNPFSNFVLIENQTFCKEEQINPYQVLSTSAGRAHKRLEQHVTKTSHGLKMTLTLDGLTLGTATGLTEVEARRNCALISLQMLRESCYTLRLKDRLAGSVVQTAERLAAQTAESQNSTSTPTPASEETPAHLAEDSKVNRMMKLMGWGGGGLGKDQQGREKPVEVEQRVRRAGLGLNILTGKGAKDPGLAFKRTIHDVLRTYQKSNATHDLIFASDYSKEERAQIHVIARKYHCKSVSYGTGANRQLVVSKNLSPSQLVSEVLKAGGSTDKYDVVPPGSL